MNKQQMVRERKEIARDVIAQIKAARYLATQGTYLQLINGDENEEESVRPVDIFQRKDNTQANLIIRKSVDRCEVCAIGAVFMSALDKHNELTANDARLTLNDDFAMLSYLKPWFSSEQMRKMEASFEADGSELESPQCLDFTEAEDHIAILWGAQYGDPEDCMIAIMKNIIDSEDGLFHPEADILFAKASTRRRGAEVFMLNGDVWVEGLLVEGMTTPHRVRRVADVIDKVSAKVTDADVGEDCSINFGKGVEVELFIQSDYICIGESEVRRNQPLSGLLRNIADQWEAQI